MGTGVLTDLQLAVMNTLWDVGEGTVGDIHAVLARKGKLLAPTTVATLLQRLSKQGWIKHRQEGRQFVYRAAKKQKEVANTVLQRVLSSFFGGNVSAMAAQLLESDQLRPEDLEEMRSLIKKKRG